MIYAFLAQGFEEVEAIAAIDVIRRAEIDICTVGVGSKVITGAHGISVICDLEDSNVFTSEEFDGVLLPGGMPGTLNLENCAKVSEFIDYAAKNDKLICAICAAPSILGHKGLLKNKTAVCFPGFEDELTGAKVLDDFVVTDGNIITAKGMGSAVEFGLAAVKKIKGEDFAEIMKKSLQCPY